MLRENCNIDDWLRKWNVMIITLEVCFFNSTTHVQTQIFMLLFFPLQRTGKIPVKSTILTQLPFDPRTLNSNSPSHETNPKISLNSKLPFPRSSYPKPNVNCPKQNKYVAQY